MGRTSKFDIGAFAQSLAQAEPAAPAAERDIETIIGEIIQLKQFRRDLSGVQVMRSGAIPGPVRPSSGGRGRWRRPPAPG